MQISKTRETRARNNTHHFVIHSEYDENGLSIQEIILNSFHNFMVLETTSAAGNASSIFTRKTGKTKA